MSLPPLPSSFISISNHSFGKRQMLRTDPEKETSLEARAEEYRLPRADDASSLHPGLGLPLSRWRRVRTLLFLSPAPCHSLSLSLSLSFPHQDMAPPSLRGSSWELGAGVTPDVSFSLPCSTPSTNPFTSPVNVFFPFC